MAGPTSWPALCLDCAWITSQTARLTLWPFLSTNKRFSKRKCCRTLTAWLFTLIMINLDLLRIHMYWKSLVSISFICCVRSRAPPTVDGKGPRSQQQALKSQILTFIWYLRMCFQTWDNLSAVNIAKCDSAFPLIFLTKTFVDHALTPSLTSSADPWQQFKESNTRSSFRNETEWNLYLIYKCFMAISLCGSWELQGQQSRVNHRK